MGSMMPLRISLTAREQAALRKHSKMTGVPIARLVADAVRAQVLAELPPGKGQA
jgi:hypothetical protein